ncbi:MAG TPA: hypothetical protein VMF09_12985 [Solirubrobacteraceae bacterium]|nr:hypothetical protein [Solirubrobacteraceae bacterium]
MGLFGKRQQNTGAVRLPADFARTLEQYGRWTFDPPGSGIDPSQIGGGNIEYELFMLAQDDSDAFVRAVAAVALPAGGWALYGGSRAVLNAVGTDVDHPDYLALLDASIDFIGRQYGMARLAPYEIRRLEQTRSETGERAATSTINESER